MELIPSCQALPKDQDKNKMATAKEKVESLMGIRRGRCSKGTWKQCLELTGDLIVEIVTKCGRFSTTHVTILDPTARLSACDPRLHSYRHIKDIGQTNGQIMLKLHCDQKV